MCGATSDGAHFSVEACRACAAFFRRSIALSRVYECRRDNRCPISAGRWCVFLDAFQMFGVCAGPAGFKNVSMLGCKSLVGLERLILYGSAVKLHRDPNGRREDESGGEEDVAFELAPASFKETLLKIRSFVFQRDFQPEPGCIMATLFRMQTAYAKLNSMRRIVHGPEEDATPDRVWELHFEHQQRVVRIGGWK